MLNCLVFSWHLNLITLIVLAILCLLYTVSILFAGRGGSHPPINMWRVLAFVAAILLRAFVLLTPFDTVASAQLFSARMVQAVVLTTLCSPLLLPAGHDWSLWPFLVH